MTGTAVTLDENLSKLLDERGDVVDRAMVERAFRFGEQAHRGQKRLSGEAFISHSVAVAEILLRQFLDTTSVVAALLHDVVEDSDVSIDEVRAEFGDEVGDIVDGLTKISSITFRSSEEQQAENYRKFLLSIAKDARVIMVKLADRLHNMRTIEHLDAEKQSSVALETREIYAPLAHRFGMAGMKSELEDLAFKVLEPNDYQEIAEEVQATRMEREKLIDRLRVPLSEELERAGLENVEVTGRAKHLWSIYRKMKQRGKPFEKIYDLMAVRVLVDSKADCYSVLGLVHNRWTHIQERIKDYVASPKSNAYQSLHTTLFGPGSQLYEIQIRTREMHRTAEYGIAAHWLYKEDRADELDDQFSWFRQLLDLQADSLSPSEFLEFLKIDLYQDEIFVFTPRGDVKRLPQNATPIDFAFAVHTEVGLRCKGAKVDGRIAPLHRTLRNGETVEILTGSQPRPSRDWLDHVRTARARHKIRQWIRQQEAVASIALGREMLARELRRRRLPNPDHKGVQQAVEAFSVGSEDSLYQAVGSGDLAVGQVLKSLFPERKTEELEVPKPTAFGRVLERLRLGRGVKIQGMGGIMVRYAQCCQPVPGDRVVGFVTKGRGISIHRRDCPNLLVMSSDPERRVEIDWQSDGGEVFVVKLSVTGEDRRGLYADLMSAISQTGTNIKSAQLSTGDGTMFGSVLVEVENQNHLQKVLNAMRRVKGTVRVERRDRSLRT